MNVKLAKAIVCTLNCIPITLFGLIILGSILVFPIGVILYLIEGSNKKTAEILLLAGGLFWVYYLGIFIYIGLHKLYNKALNDVRIDSIPLTNNSV